MLALIAVECLGSLQGQYITTYLNVSVFVGVSNPTPSFLLTYIIITYYP
jgi:hypothetical protein